MTIVAAERSLLGTIVDLAVWAGEVVEFLVHGIIIAFVEWGGIFKMVYMMGVLGRIVRLKQ